MQKFCISETGYKIPKIDCIKLQSQSKLLGHFCDFSSSQYCAHDLVIESQETALGGKRKPQESKKTVFALRVPTTAVFVSGIVGLSLE